MTATPARHTRMSDLPASFWWLWAAELVTWIGRFVVPFMTIFLTKHVGLTAGEAGVVVSTYGIGVVLSSLVGGILADRLGRKTVLAWSLILSVAVLVAIPSVQGSLVTAAFLFVYGLFNGAAGPVIITMIGDIVPAAHRRTAYNYNYWAINLGWAVGPMLAGYLADSNFSLLFYGQALLLVASLVIVLLRVPETRTSITEGSSDVGPLSSSLEDVSAPPLRAGKGITAVLRDRVFVTFTLVMFLYSVVYNQSTTSLPLIMTAQGFASSSYGHLLTLNGLLLCLLQIPSARILGRWSRERVTAAAIALTAVGVGLQSVAGSMTVYFLTVAIWTLGELGSHAQAQSISADLARRELRGRYQGVYSLNFNLATVVGPVVGGFALDHLGARGLWIIAAGVCLVVAVILTLTSGARNQRVASLAEDDEPTPLPQDGDPAEDDVMPVEDSAEDDEPIVTPLACEVAGLTDPEPQPDWTRTAREQGASR
ncbi:MFS transporter [Brooklawnia cerclae]|uniref:MFS family permease n=1 Tax=Brooklawnia cerclae TaxID=349934 RepID=A0ABX0SB96_9ACTN|nr:MFS transporter [Brooklawnia cerclae]NIH55669.1 MFS family permease [Brooklawnia cerclae]